MVLSNTVTRAAEEKAGMEKLTGIHFNAVLPIKPPSSLKPQKYSVSNGQNHY